MSRRLITVLVVSFATGARADDADPTPPSAAPEPTPPPPTATAAATPPSSAETATTTQTYDDVSDQGLGAELGMATGGRVTPGGLRVTGHYYYQMSADDWFDGTAAFTFGGGGAACFRDRLDVEVCQHGFTDGGGIEIGANVRRLLPPNGKFRPFARVGIGVTYVRFSADNVSGIAFPLHLGGGVRTSISRSVAVIAQGEVDIGFGAFNHRLGIEPQVGVVLTAGAEFRLR